MVVLEFKACVGRRVDSPNARLEKMGRSCSDPPMPRPHIVVIGGGAAGFFAAIAAAEFSPGACDVTLLEATAHLLAKVRISGGGRCNVTHACFEPKELVKRYPRGGRELLGAFHRFGPKDTIAWYESRGVTLKTESDGRMFPITDDSGTIVAALMNAASKAGVRIRTGCGIAACQPMGLSADQTIAISAGAKHPAPGAGFQITLVTGESMTAQRVILATGGMNTALIPMIEAWGHTVEAPVPSLFTFHIDDPRLAELSGLTVPDAATQVEAAQLRERGPLLITHWGMSGPAVLKLSAWGARELAACDYRFTLTVNFSPEFNRETARSALIRARNETPRRQVSGSSPFPVPGRLWARLVAAAGIGEITTWSQTSNEALALLAEQVTQAQFEVTRKSPNKEEFVTCGGVTLNEVDFRTMESRRCAGIHFAGEVLDIDGITGGYNFQAAWTTGYLAGRAAVTSLKASV